MTNETPKDVQAAEAAAKAAKHLFDNKDEKFSWSEFWESMKDRAVRFAGALIMERNNKDQWVISIGRISWWMAFGPALYIWLVNNGVTDPELIKDITPNHLTILLTLAGYNFGKKVMDGVAKVWGKDEGPG